MIRFIIVAMTVILFLILSIPILIVEYLIGRKHPEVRDRHSRTIIRSMFRFIIWETGSKVTVNGLENIPRDQAVLFVGNHRSYFDILVGYSSVIGLTGFVAKKEMEKIPLLSTWMFRIHCLFLDRENMREGLKTILEGIEKVKAGISIWIFPEGTRHSDSYDMLPFHEGSMKIADKSGCPVIPVAISGTAEIFEQHFPKIRPSHVIITFGPPIHLKDLPKDQKKASGAYTRSVIAQMLENQGKDL